MSDGPFDNGSVAGLWTYPNGRDGGAVRNEEIWQRLNSMRAANLPKAHAWREAALADGWEGKPTYDHEPIEHAARLTREDWVCLILSRPLIGKDGSSNSPDITVWGPDRAQIAVPVPYDWAAMQAAIRVCAHCGKTDVETKCYAFADRCCIECGPPYQKSLPANWCD
jgi:hypothetical protein